MLITRLIGTYCELVFVQMPGPLEIWRDEFMMLLVDRTEYDTRHHPPPLSPTFFVYTVPTQFCIFFYALFRHAPYLILRFSETPWQKLRTFFLLGDNLIISAAKMFNARYKI